MSWIVCTHGDDKGLVEELEDGTPLVVGRQEGCGLRLLHASISRKHCEITLLGSILNVQDLGSAHGVKYKGKKYKGKSVKIKPGEVFDLSGDRLEFIHTYEQYVEVTDRIKSNLHTMNDQEMKSNYSQLVAEATRTQTMKLSKKTIFQRVKNMLAKPL